ncbi:MAG: hypothetical protein IT456_15295 [Planctomycetes bacterium]|jgi:hypothetical protein|nr:hypothetical protein [Planctomycetota bacterium]
MATGSLRHRVLLACLGSTALPAQQWLPHTLPQVPSAATVTLRDVDGTAPDDVWVVGSYTVNHPGYTVQNTLAMHYDGVAWSIVPAPNPIGPGGPQNQFSAVKAFAPDDVWVAGSWYTLGGNWLPTSDLYVAHWDGVSWTPMVTTASSPNGSGHGITDIVASGPDDIWFLGNVVTGYSQALALHWDGSSFQFRYGPPPPATPGANRIFRSGAVIAGNDAWFVGGPLNYMGTFSYLVHSDGSSMSIVPGATSSNTYLMTSVAALATNDVWVLGEEQVGSNLSVLLWRWDGSSWNQAPQWQSGFHAHSLHSTGKELLAGGLGGIQRWDGVAWRNETTLAGYATPVVQVMGNAGSSVFAIGGAGGVPSTPFLIERVGGITVRTPCVGIAPPASMVVNTPPRLGQAWSVAIGDPSNAAQLQPGMTSSFWVVSWRPAPGHPCGVTMPGTGFGGRLAELLVDSSPGIAAVIDSPRVWNGPATSTTHLMQVPVVPALVGMSLFTQGVLLEVGPMSLSVVLTNAIDFVIGS